MNRLKNKLATAPRGSVNTLRLAMRIANGNDHKPRKAGSRNRNRIYGTMRSTVSDLGLPPLVVGLYAKAGILPGVGDHIRKGSNKLRPQAEVEAAIAAAEAAQ